MDRVTTYFDQVPLETDVLRTGQYAMVGLAKLSEALLGTGMAVAGFPCAPTAPASLSVTLGPGQVYEQENLEASAWSSLPADTHTIVKQGILLDAVGLTFTPPPTPGYSQAFLIEVQYQDSDTLSVVLPYYNAANPDVTLDGPAGSGAAQNTARKGAVAYQIKAGIAATSGTQVAPAPDAGWAGLYVVTLAYGATTVTAGNIAAYANAPFIPVTLPGVPAAVQSGKWTYGIDSGTASALVIALTPSPAQLTPGMEVLVAAAAACSGASVANVAGTGNLPLVRRGGLGTVSGDWSLGDMLALRLNKNGSAWMLGGVVPSDILAQITAAQIGIQSIQTFSTPGTFTYTPSAGTRAVLVEVLGAGGGGGGTNAPGSGGVSMGVSGGAGAYTSKYLLASTFASASVVVGAPGAGGPATGSGGGNGGTSSFTPNTGTPVVCTGGGGGVNTGTVAAFPQGTTTASGGSASGGDIPGTGGCSQAGLFLSSAQALVGPAGSTRYGQSPIQFGITAAGAAGLGFGAGGTGGLAYQNAAAQIGGSGAPGLVRITEFK